MFRFSLRTLLVLTLAFAVLLALPIRRAIKQKRGRDWVAAQGGHVTFAHQYNVISGEYDHDAELQAPAWLVNIVGIDFFDSVHTVVLDNTMVKDLQPITNPRDLRRLAIISEIDDRLDFAPLANLPCLRDRHLGYTQITVQRMANLRGLLPQVRVDATNHPPPEKGGSPATCPVGCEVAGIK